MVNDEGSQCAVVGTKSLGGGTVDVHAMSCIDVVGGERRSGSNTGIGSGHVEGGGDATTAPEGVGEWCGDGDEDGGAG